MFNKMYTKLMFERECTVFEKVTDVFYNKQGDSSWFRIAAVILGVFALFIGIMYLNAWCTQFIWNEVLIDFIGFKLTEISLLQGLLGYMILWFIAEPFRGFKKA